MNSRNIFDVCLYLLNKDIFMKVLEAEIKYFSVICPFLNKHQIRGKALEVMGIKTTLGEISNVSKLLPFIYKRKIMEPIQTWLVHYLERIFQPVILLAEEMKCVRKNKSSLKSLKFPKLLKNKNFDQTDYDEIFNIDEDKTESLSGNISLKNKKNSNFKRNIFFGANKTRAKTSESNAMIMWPFQTQALHQKNELNLPQNHCSISERYLEFHVSSGKQEIKKNKYSKQRKNIENTDIPEKFSTTNTNKENYETQKQIIHARERDGKVLLTISEDNILKGKPSENKKGFLTDLFTPATPKRMLPENVMPIIKYRRPTSVNLLES